MKEIALSIMYVFRQFAKFLSKTHATSLGGNVDLYYALAIPYMFEAKNKKNRMIELCIVFITLFGYSALQFLVLEDLNVLKLIVNTVKIFVCFAVFRYTMDKIHKVNLARTILTISVMFFGLTVMAVVFSESTWFWRFNDGVNLFSLTRLQLFYLEPSELGYHLLLVMIPLTAVFLLSKRMKIKLISGLFLVTNAVTLYLAKPLGAIAIGAVAIVAVILYEFLLHPTKSKLRLYVILVVVVLAVLALLYVTENPLILRIIYTLQGKDGSNNYRVGVSLEVLKRSLIDYNLIGCGFGNLNTEAFISNYRPIGLSVVVVNSFIYFIIEAGVLGVVVVSCLIGGMIYKTLKDKSIVKMGLSVFVIIYSLFGGHFTSAVTWVVYGIIFSNWKDADMIEGFESFLRNYIRR